MTIWDNIFIDYHLGSFYGLAHVIEVILKIWIKSEHFSQIDAFFECFLTQCPKNLDIQINYLADQCLKI